MKNQISQRVKAVRLATGLNQEDFAKEVGVSTSVISKVETEVIPTTDNLTSKIAQRFSFDESYFIGNDKIDLSHLKEAVKRKLGNESGTSPWREEAYNLLKDELKDWKAKHAEAMNMVSMLIQRVPMGKFNGYALTAKENKRAPLLRN